MKYQWDVSETKIHIEELDHSDLLSVNKSVLLDYEYLQKNNGFLSVLV